MAKPEAEERLVPISALEHFSYCPRQCGLIHVEQVFEENVFTIRGQLSHEKVDEGEANSKEGTRIVRSAPLWSERLGLTGKCDVVEFRPEGPYPVEYKVGRPRGRHAEYQLCAQALCLEEMLGASVPLGAIYYRAIGRRREVAIDSALRQETEEMTAAIRTMVESEELPPPVDDERCPTCSLVDVCLPTVVNQRARLRGLQATLFQPLAPGDDDE